MEVDPGLAVGSLGTPGHRNNSPRIKAASIAPWENRRRVEQHAVTRYSMPQGIQQWIANLREGYSDQGAPEFQFNYQWR
ncbi:hypothetical protein [Nitrosomonas communis]|uniref:hypothetical protein n=1 Tax=Nitrosomonas communis TaxID=44574 RepID=UPI0026F235E6|nr:hypothetical protein [Nitrosomonas communis]MCO6427135.1 hypothetical protein [Nitrosomonas communis]